MDERIKIPEEFKGNWENLLILTFGADIPFWENSLWRQLGGSCRNIIIIADGNQYLKEMSQCARSGLARYLNQKYIFDGIFVPHAAHAKCVLLTSSKSGRLFVGSGNLGLDGYASGGELFTKYEYDQDNADNLIAFLGLKEYLDALIEGKLVSEITSQHIHRLYTNSPWIYSKPKGSLKTVRHNLEESFLAQLQALIGEEPILKIWAMAPFYDKECKALRMILQKLRPEELILLLQPKFTSVDPSKLKEMMASSLGKYMVKSAHPKDVGKNTYIHAKLIIVETPTREICLQGSPNLSRVAMVNSGASANHEIANLIMGDKGEFTSLLERLDISADNVDPSSLEVSYREADSDDEIQNQAFYLISGEINDDQLKIRFKGDLINSANLRVKIGNVMSTIKVDRLESDSFTSKVTEEIIEILAEPLPISVATHDTNLDQFSNSIFVLNIVELDKMLDAKPTGSSDQGLKSLDFDDEEMENLLSELEGSMLIDRRSVWQLAGKDIPKNNSEEEDTFQLDFGDIDFEMLRSHPKIQQYTSPSSGQYGRFYDLPVPRVLASILEAFELSKSKRRDQRDGSSSSLADDAGTIVDIIPPEDGGEETDGGRQRRSSRIKRVLKRFIKRFIRGLSSQDYIEFAGPKIFTRNYIIFLRLLWLLFSKDYLEEDFIIRSLLQIWTNYFGSASKMGVYEVLNSEEKDKVNQMIAEYHSDSLMISSLYYSAYLSRANGWHDIRMGLRDFWNDFISDPPISMENSLIENAWNFLSEINMQDTIKPSRMIQELVWLSRSSSDEELLSQIAEQSHLPNNCCSFQVEKVMKPAINKTSSSKTLTIDYDDALESLEKAINILQTWRKFDDREYYRIKTKDQSHLLWYDTRSENGVYHIKEPRKTEDISSLPLPRPPKWQSQMEKLKHLAKEVEEMNPLG
jgi:hypothetical protein